jgi:threonyl-tRNA synthetase
VLIEHFAGAFPFWLAPVPVGIVPIKPQHNGYALDLKERLAEQGVYAEADLNDTHMSNKIKEYQLAKAPYILVVGDKETQNGTVAVRIRGGAQAVVGAGAFIGAAAELKRRRSLGLEGFGKI